MVLTDNNEIPQIRMAIVHKAVEIERLYRKMVEEIQDYAIILLDLDGNILTWNPGAERIKGYTAAEIIGQNFCIFYTPDARQARLPQQLLARAKKEGRARDVGKRVRRDGKLFWGNILITAIHDDNSGEVIGYAKLTRELRDNETD
jgi:PAS domain S-box-containing protein